MYFDKNIKHLRESAALSQEKFGELFKLADTTVSNYEKGRSKPNVDLLIEICKYFDTDPTTLMFTDLSGGGAGLSIKDIEPGAVPFYNLTVSAGTAGLGAFWEQEQPVGYLKVPEFKECLAAFRVSGMSMEPEIKDGDVILIKAADRQHFTPTKIYMVVTPDERMIKRVSPIPDKKGLLECRSSNTDFSPFQLRVSEVVAMYRVIGVIRLV